MNITFKVKGSWSKTETWLKKSQNLRVDSILARYGQAGVDALANATPKLSGRTAASWDYNIEKTSSGYSLTWHNMNIVNGAPIAILIQYGHGTGTGGYVRGIDYINPALKPIFEKIASDIWKEVSIL